MYDFSDFLVVLFSEERLAAPKRTELLALDECLHEDTILIGFRCSKQVCKIPDLASSQTAIGHAPLRLEERSS